MYQYRHRARLVVHLNPEGRTRHEWMLAGIREAILSHPARYHVVTEHDALPGPDWLTPPAHAIEVAEYVTRDPKTMRLVGHGIPGAWWIGIDKEALLRAGLTLNFAAGGRFNDPCNLLAGATLLPYRDDWPASYGVRVAEKCVHLFWSRHYNDPGWTRAAGFYIGDIQRKVDERIATYRSPTDI